MLLQKIFRLILTFIMVSAWVAGVHAETLTIAAAADLKFALDEVAALFRAAHPGERVEVVYGSSGKFHTQIEHGAPFDLFFSADKAYPQALADKGLTAGQPVPYAEGRIVLWSHDPALAKLPLKALAAEGRVRRLALANPRHAPYGQRGMEALQHEGVWRAIEPRLVLGENVAQAAQFIDSGAAEAGIIALSLARSPALAGRGEWTLIPAEWHAPLEQAFVITRRGAGNALAQAFARHVSTPEVRAVLHRHGFILPADPGHAEGERARVRR